MADIYRANACLPGPPYAERVLSESEPLSGKRCANGGVPLACRERSDNKSSLVQGSPNSFPWA
jgi:hypothetical protein